MSLEKKSYENDTAAALLCDAGIFSASIHCSYYSVLQLCSHLIKSTDGYTYEDLRAKHQLGLEKRNLGSHQLIRKEILNKVRQAQNDNQKNRMDFTIFNNYFNSLKLLREQSDYEDVLIDRNQAKDATAKANRLKTIIKNTYKR